MQAANKRYHHDENKNNAAADYRPSLKYAWPKTKCYIEFNTQNYTSEILC